MVETFYVLKIEDEIKFKSKDLNQVIQFLEDKNIIVKSIDELFDSSILKNYKFEVNVEYI